MIADLAELSTALLVLVVMFPASVALLLRKGRR